MPSNEGTPYENETEASTPQSTPPAQSATFTEQYEDEAGIELRRTQVTKNGKQWCWSWFDVTATGAKLRHRAYGGTWNTLSEQRKEQYYVNRERYWKRKARADHRREIEGIGGDSKIPAD